MKRDFKAMTGLVRVVRLAICARWSVGLMVVGLAACGSTTSPSNPPFIGQQVHSLVNGESWASGSFWSDRYISGDTTFIVGLGHPDSLDVGLIIHVVHYHGFGSYILGKPGSGSFAEVQYYRGESLIATYSTSASSGGTLKTGVGELTGTFAYTATPSSPSLAGLPDRVQVTDGSFHLALNPTR